MNAVASANPEIEFATQWQGQVVDGRFPLEQYLGGSEQQAVFLTRTHDGKRAAIKLVRASAGDPEAQLSAWRRAAKLSHPNLIRIFDCGRCWFAGHDLVFVVSEFAEEDLGQVLPQRPLSGSEAESMLASVVDALAYLHGQGLAHGNIKPSNVMAINEQVKLSSDRIQPPGTQLRALNESAYDAPEMTSGQLSQATDVWALGRLVTESLTQRAELKQGVSLPQPFTDMVRRCVVGDPAARWTIRDVSARLQPAGANAKKEAAEPVRGKSVKSRKAVWLALALVTIVAVAAVVIYRGSSSERRPQQAIVPAIAPAITPSSATVTNSRGTVVNRKLPDPSRSALNTIHGRIKVRVRVEVNSTGNVSEATFITRGPSQYFARLALQAAQEWKFSTAIRDGQPVPSEWNLLFEYTRRGVQVSEQARER